MRAANPLKNFLTKTPVLWILAVVMILIGMSFGYVSQVYEINLLDEISDPERVRSSIAAMSEEQKRVHLWTTGVLDVAFPLAYGGLFVGLAWRFLGAAGPLLALPGLAVIPIDLTEGVVQIMALGGNNDVVVHKAWVTPLKFGLFLPASLIALFALGLAVRRKFFGRASA